MHARGLLTPGRSCPAHYRYRAEVFATEAPTALRGLDVLYVVGGLYGNELALERALSLFEREKGEKRLVFNGDFHWFDVDPAIFDRVQREVLAHVALRGNVETELATPGADAGCGCAYPEWVDDGIVERSNRILGRLRAAAGAQQRAELAGLPMWLRVDVAGLRIGVVHGDAESLAGWGFSQEHLAQPGHRVRAQAWLRAGRVDAFACTHTCLPVFQSLEAGWVLNNGAAGMPNFADDGAGLLTRVAITPYEGAERRFGVRLGQAYVDGIAIEIDRDAALRRFLAQWPAGSDAHASYFRRISGGPAYWASNVVRRAS
jgi:predicted phosphodiesterase